MLDLVVIGLGGVGSYALRAASQIAKEQQRLHTHSKKHAMKILGIEKFTPCHEFGSSHGKSRIYRHAYFEHPNYVPLIQYSTDEFKSVQRNNNTKLLEECGNLIIEDKGLSPNDSIIAKCIKSARQHQIKVERLSSQDLREKYPQFHNIDKMEGLLENGGGFVRPELAIEGALQDAIDNGAMIWDNMQVEGIREVVDIDSKQNSKDSFVEISLANESTTKVIQSRKVIIAAGSWTSRLIPSWSPLLTVTRQIQAWVDTTQLTKAPVLPHMIYQSHQMPTWIMRTKQLDAHFFGIPADPYSCIPSHIKFAIHGRDVEIDPDSRNPPVTDAENQELRHVFQSFFRDALQFKLTKSKSCMYTMTPDEHFLIGRPEEFHNVYAAAGLSGHGFKMVPGLGKVLADLAMNGETDFDVNFLSPTRFCDAHRYRQEMS